MSDLKTLLTPLIEGFSGWENVRGMQELSAGELPQPYRALLAHKRDMTGTLSQFFGQSLHLKVLEKALKQGVLARRVLLIRDGDGLPVEYGAIRIHLDHYPEQAREPILEGRQPLGGILNAMDIPYRSKPRRFIKIQQSDILKQVFHPAKADFLYGRCNILATPGGETLAEIVEVLPPLDPK